jgi:homoserine dehydrogenase
MAGACIERALKLGKPVVTANKSLLAARGAELISLAKRHQTCIAFEASCGGGIPIVNALINGLAANRIDALVGIVNGTCNFILTQMTRLKWSYDAALKEAQNAGFAEANPTMDVSGRDAAQKLALLASLAFNVGVAESDIHIEGIDTLQATDIQLAEELGYVIKLLAIAERKTDGQGGEGNVAYKASPGGGAAGEVGAAGCGDAPSALILRVHPTLVHKDDVLAEVGGSFNAISVYGDALGHALFYGRGAGAMPTASAVVADLIGVGMGSLPIAFAQMGIFPDTTPPARVLPIEALRSRYYLRLTARDEPGALAQVARALGEHGISVSAIHQHESDESQVVPVVITTHKSNEGAMRAALKAIDALPTITAATVCLRIVDPPREFGM